MTSQNRNRIILLALLFFLLGTDVQAEEDSGPKIEELKQSIEKLEQELQVKKTILNALEEKVLFLENEIERLVSLLDLLLPELDQDHLAQLAREAWVYKLKVNDQEVPPSGQLKIEDGNFTLQLIEKIPPGSLYFDHQELLQPGCLENYKVELLTPEKLYRKTSASGTIVDVPVAFVFKDLPPGTQVKLEICVSLQDRLNLNTRLIKIEVQ